MHDTGPTSQTFISQRLRLHYLDWGGRGKPPLVLVHGGRDHARSWDWTAEALREDWHVIALDHRGHGDSEWVSDGNYRIMDMVYDVAQLIHQLDLAPVTIVAHSMGAALALRYAAIRQLGQYFTTHVTIQTQHQLIANGPYRWLRHPAYSGLLLAFSAAGLAMGDGLALLVIICACGGVLAYRIGVEERLLHDCFGPAFNDYCQTRKRLIPGIW
jgi:pimeloyl-ACP methyl ester carboxylesterase